MVWTDVQQAIREDIAAEVAAQMFRVKTYDEWMKVRLRWRLYYPYYGFNAQRVDLVLK